jgi:hypothetical protein
MQINTAKLPERVSHMDVASDLRVSEKEYLNA